MKIRLYQSSDKNDVIALWKQVFHPQTPYNDPESVINMKVKQDDDFFFVAEDKQHIIGTIMIGFDGHRGWLYSLAVHSQHRRKGVGTLLVNEALKKLKKIECLKVNLQINADNHEVVKFYKKLGFSVEDRISMGRVLY